MTDDLGRIIREKRERRGWSQEFLAAKVGATQSTIDRIENGTTRRSRVLPMIASVLDLNIPEFRPPAHQQQTVNGLVKVSYVLPEDLVERIGDYKAAIGVSSDDEAVRRLIDDQLKKRDDVDSIVKRLMNKFRSVRSMREAAGFVLANHPLVKSISFDDQHIVFELEEGFIIEASSWGSIYIEKSDKKPYMYHTDSAPKWLDERNLTTDWDLVDAPPF